MNSLLAFEANRTELVNKLITENAKRVGGVLANHPTHRLLISQICQLTGLDYIDVRTALYKLRQMRAIGRRKVKGYDRVWTYKIRQRGAKQGVLASFLADPG